MTSLQNTSPKPAKGRHRVSKACDRCRLKKTKCNGSSPCQRYQADDAICIFGERKKLLDRVHPKGYVEMLETQQTRLVSGLQALYKQSQGGHGWIGPPLKEAVDGLPPTHDILERLGALKQEVNNGDEQLKDDVGQLRQRNTGGSGLTHQRTTLDEQPNIDCASTAECMLPTTSYFVDRSDVDEFSSTLLYQASSRHRFGDAPLYGAQAVSEPSLQTKSQPLLAQSSMGASAQESPTWSHAAAYFDNEMDPLGSVQSSMEMDSISPEMLEQLRSPTIHMTDLADHCEGWEDFFGHCTFPDTIEDMSSTSILEIHP